MFKVTFRLIIKMKFITNLNKKYAGNRATEEKKRIIFGIYKTTFFWSIMSPHTAQLTFPQQSVALQSQNKQCRQQRIH